MYIIIGSNCQYDDWKIDFIFTPTIEISLLFVISIDTNLFIFKVFLFTPVVIIALLIKKQGYRDLKIVN